VGAARCFLMAGLEPEIGHARRFCQTSCQDCVYYRRVNGLATHVLLITSDDSIVESLSGDENESIALRYARTPYEASAIIHEFRPAFAVIGEELAQTGEGSLLNSLAADPRVPGLRVILLAAEGTRGRRRARPKHDLIVSCMNRPVSLSQIAGVISRFPVDSPSAAEDNL
jgi:hypothetical protein